MKREDKIAYYTKNICMNKNKEANCQEKPTHWGIVVVIIVVINQDPLFIQFAKDQQIEQSLNMREMAFNFPRRY